MGQRSVGGNSPALNGTLPIVGYAQPDLRALRIAVGFSDNGCRHQASNLGRDRRWRVATLFFPALGAK